MRKNAVNAVLGVFVAVAFALAGCIGDGGDTPTNGGDITNAEVIMLRMNNNPDVNGTPDYKYFVESYIDDPNHIISSASLTGMGNTSAYAYNSSTKKWWDDSASRYSTKSPVFPMDYTIFITYKDGHNSTLARTVSSWSIAQ